MTPAIIDPAFQQLLPALQPEELEQLEKNVLADPNHERMPPVITWGNGNNEIVDGNNQFQLRKQHNLEIRVTPVDFNDVESAMRYALDVQFGRRNLDPSQRAIAYANLPRLSEGRPSENVANLQCLSELAEAAHVSKRTMSDAAKVADNGAEPVIEGVRNGEFTASDAAKIVSLPIVEQKQLVEMARCNGSTLSRARISGGITFNPVELEAAPRRKAATNGASVVPGREREIALGLISKLSRSLKSLDLFDKHNRPLSEMIRDVKALK